MGTLHNLQISGVDTGSGTDAGSKTAAGSEVGLAPAVGGADCVLRSDGKVSFGVLGDVLGAGFITSERYVSAMLLPRVDEGWVVESRSVDRTNATGLRRMPEVNGRACSGGRQ